MVLHTEIMNTSVLKNKFRAALRSRGIGTLPLITVFKQFDVDDSGELSWDGK